jgi:hypothetical protein
VELILLGTSDPCYKALLLGNTTKRLKHHNTVERRVVLGGLRLGGSAPCGRAPCGPAACALPPGVVRPVALRFAAQRPALPAAKRLAVRLTPCS